jgi:hypothetical protein
MPGVDFSQFDHPREEQQVETAEAKTSTVNTELKWD